MKSKNEPTPSSSTDREKVRNKPLMMIITSAAVRDEKQASRREKQRNCVPVLIGRKE